ncbi:MAG: tRNA-dihydrouridine synthase family protein [Bacteroidales bacterium]|jgi:nifR3 family TIM-barrel protein|nr:tRNA-dihydrouridine synthase family protein [Bacteroidales bacterium]
MFLKDKLKPFSLILSPMEAVTNPPFRKICKDYGADVLITEFISADALIREVEASKKKMFFVEAERPVGIQIFGNNEESLIAATEMAVAANPDFIDINWGCPVRKVAGKGCGSGILNDVPKMIYLTKKVVEHSHLPVSVKTRLGYDENEKPVVYIAEALQDIGISAISIHGRTRAAMYKGKADWTLIGEVKANPRMQIPVFGNGDIDSAEKVVEFKERYGVDGILIGRAAIGNPFIFFHAQQALKGEKRTPISVSERVRVCKQHLEGLIQWRSEKLALFEMRKFYSGYFYAINNFKPYRIRLVTAASFEEVYKILNEIEEDFTI